MLRLNVSQMRQDGLDPVGQWRRKLHALARRRMGEGQPRRVKGDTPETVDQLDGNRVASLLSAISHVTDEGMAQRGQVDADLMGTPRLETALEIGEPGKTLEHAEARHGTLARAGPRHGHAHAGACIARDRRVDHTAVTSEPPMSQAEVATRHGPAAELSGEGIIGRARYTLPRAIHAPAC